MSKEVTSIGGYSLSDKKARAHLAEVDSQALGANQLLDYILNVYPNG